MRVLNWLGLGFIGQWNRLEPDWTQFLHKLHYILKIICWIEPKSGSSQDQIGIMELGMSPTETQGEIPNLHSALGWVGPISSGCS